MLPGFQRLSRYLDLTRNLKVTALSIAFFNVFLIPLDVGNQGNSTSVYGQGGLPMSYITVSFYSISMIFMLVLIPFTVFFYEGDDETDKGPDSRYVIRSNYSEVLLEGRLAMR